MSFLLVDLGNSRVKCATTAYEGPLRLAGQLPTANLSVGWIRALAEKNARLHLVLASVVPKWNSTFARAFRGRVTIVSGKLPELKDRFDYPNPAELGADRIAAAIAAYADQLCPAIIVACGTATAYTVIDGHGRLCGGAIAPGLQAQLDALVGATAQLPSPALKMPFGPLAKSTADAIRAGVLLSFQGGVKETVTRLDASLPGRSRPHLIVTGGDGKLAAAALGSKAILRPLLVLEGLRIIGCYQG
jgi:type III pantothenate kinase